MGGSFFGRRSPHFHATQHRSLSRDRAIQSQSRAHRDSVAERVLRLQPAVLVLAGQSSSTVSSGSHRSPIGQLPFAPHNARHQRRAACGPSAGTGGWASFLLDAANSARPRPAATMAKLTAGTANMNFQEMPADTTQARRKEIHPLKFGSSFFELLAQVLHRLPKRFLPLLFLVGDALINAF